MNRPSDGADAGSRGHDAPYDGPYARDLRDAALDGDGPLLHPSETQRLNRRALLFLAGIVALLGGLAFWLFSGTRTPGDGVRGAPAVAEQVVIPAAPRDLPELPVPRAASAATLPPLPVIDDAPDGTGADMRDGLQTAVRRIDALPSLLERRIQDAFANGQPDATASPHDAPGLPPALARTDAVPVTQMPADGATRARLLRAPDTLLLRGTYIRCVLQSRVVSDFPGYTACVVTEPVYSANGRRLLLPRGSRVMGFYGADSVVGDRAGIVWDRITTPTGLDVDMRSPGVDALGAAGNPGHYDAHWGQRLGSALLISMLSDVFKYAAAEHGRPQTSIGNGFVVQNPYESNTARTLERLANTALDRNMTRPPTVTINQGTLVNVYVARDVDFSAVVR